MGDVEFQITQLVNLAIGSPEVGAVNFNLLQKVLVEILRLTDLESATVRLSGADAAKLEDTYQVKPLPKSEQEEPEDEEVAFTRRSGQGHQCPIDPEKVDQLLEDINQLKFDIDDLMNKVTTMTASADTVPFQEMRKSLSQVDGLHEKIQTIEKTLEGMKELSGTGNEDQSVGQRLMQLETTAERHDEQIVVITKAVEENTKDIKAHLENLEKEMGEMSEKVNLSGTTLQGKKSASERTASVMDPQHTQSSINNLLSRLSSVQHDLDNLTILTNDLKDEHEQRQMIIDVLTEQVEMLKIIKADKTNMEDILAAKADMSQVHRKVSHDHFENKVDQLNTMLEDAFHRLDGHEALWQEEVEEIKLDIEQKLDKMEFTPLKDYVNEKLQILQDKMKTLASQRKESLAAGTKKRILRDVQCISCDNNSLMKLDNAADDMMPAPPLPAQQSVKPFLTYKLDQVRKQQKKLPQGRNMLHFEEMLNECVEKKNPKQSFQNRTRSSGEHLVNRFVGGSHTTTTPQQRVTRTGNFFETWGPIITAVNVTQQSAA